MHRSFALAIFTFISLSALEAAAYPNFIGYGYTTCVTCHYNTLGNGPLNDYGRALFAQEIAARPFIPESVSDEVLADKSGFVPGTELPYWIHPGLKWRGLWYQTNPGGSDKVSKFIWMQREVNLALQADPVGKYAAVFTWDLLPEPADFYGKCDGGDKCVSAIFREMYVRVLATKNLYVSAGLFDKAFGIRTADHTAVSRSLIGLGQYDQTHGLTLHWLESTWDVAVQMHMGNLNKDPLLREKGFSATGEYEIGEKHRLGLSLLSTENDGTRYKRFAVHDRWGLSKAPGSSLMWELGSATDQAKATDTTTSRTYGLAEFLIKLGRGYNLLSTVERVQTDTAGSSGESSRWSLGFLTFPFLRTEFRAGLANGKNYAPDTSSADYWMLTSQLHISY